MSCYGWEAGTILLPAAEVPALKKTLREYINALHEDVRAEAIRIHKDVCKATRSPRLYRERLTAYTQSRGNTGAHGRSYGYSSYSQTQNDRTDLVHAMAMEVLEGMLRPAWNQPEVAPHQPTVADVNRVVAKKTNRDNVFPIITRGGYGEGTISFDGRNVTWSVPENNHAVDAARESVIGEMFFAALAKIAWTRGTGGALWGNNEYNEGPHGHGRGPDRLGATFGPLGDEAQVTEYQRNGFTRAQAKQMVEAAKRPAPRRAYAW